MRLLHAHIKKRQPVLKRLQSEAAKYESNTKGSKPATREVVGVILNIWIHCYADACDKSSHQPYPDRKGPGVVKTMHEGTANKCRSNVANCPNDRSPELTTSQAWSARGYIIESRAHAARIGEYLADRDQGGKCECVFEAQNSVQSSAKSESPNSTKESLPG